MNVVVDPLLCTACGLCVELCPEVFEMGIEAAEVITDPVPLDHYMMRIPLVYFKY